jgi:hypothetical protein
LEINIDKKARSIPLIEDEKFSRDHSIFKIFIKKYIFIE